MSRVKAQARAFEPDPKSGPVLGLRVRLRFLSDPRRGGICGQHPAELDGKIPLQVLQVHVNVYG
jgi:hypothetical protein